MSHSLRLAFVLVPVLLVTTLAPARVRAARQATGDVLLSEKRFTAKRYRAERRERRERPDERAIFRARPGADSWTIHYAAVLSRALSIPDATISVYDVSRGKRLVYSRELLGVRTGQARVDGKLVLDRATLGTANARLVVEVSSRKRVLARRVFYVQGRSRDAGKREIVFDADDAAAADDDGVSLDSLAAQRARRR